MRSEEYCIPAADLDALNESIVGKIAVIRAFAPTTVTGPARTEWFAEHGRLLEWSYVHAPKEGGPYRCPCCRCLTLPERSGYDICPVCFWEDDGQGDPDADIVRGGPNADLSLTEARENYARFGAREERVLPHVRPPKPDEG
jgi:hypothetical protein